MTESRILRLSLLLLGIGLNAGSLSLTPSSFATPLTPNKLNSNTSQKGPVNPRVTISSEVKNPGLWWAKEQFGDAVLDSWLVYPSDSSIPGQIDLLVNPQNWNSLDYIQRYEFINHFGTVARSHGYSLKVLDAQKKQLAAYSCNFSQSSQPCVVQLPPTTGKSGLGGAF